MYHNNNNFVFVNSRDNIKLIYSILQKHSKITDKKKLLHNKNMDQKQRFCRIQ